MISQNIEEAFGSDYRLTSDETNAIFKHGDCGDRSGHLYVNLTNGLWFCHKCEEGGLVIVEGFEAKPNRTEKKLKPWEEVRPVSVETDPAAVEYLWRRRVSSTDAARYYIFLSQLGVYRGLIFFPVWTRREYQGWQARTYRTEGDVSPIILRDVTKRWHACSGFRRATAIWNYDKVAQGQELCLAEGKFSALAVERTGRRCIATMGKTVSRKQLLSIAQLQPSMVTIALDGDARLTAYTLGLRFNELGIPTRVVQFQEPRRNAKGQRLEEAEDPDSSPDLERKLAGAPRWSLQDYTDVIIASIKLPKHILRGLVRNERRHAA